VIINLLEKVKEHIMGMGIYSALIVAVLFDEVVDIVKDDEVYTLGKMTFDCPWELCEWLEEEYGLEVIFNEYDPSFIGITVEVVNTGSSGYDSGFSKGVSISELDSIRAKVIEALVKLNIKDPSPEVLVITDMGV
jgi:hypothetical protein